MQLCWSYAYNRPSIRRNTLVACNPFPSRVFTSFRLFGFLVQMAISFLVILGFLRTSV